MIKKIMGGGILVVILLAIVFFYEKKMPSSPASAPAPAVTNEILPVDHTITSPGGQAINVRVADTEAEREQGLSGIAAMSEDQGMLFLFDSPAKYGFWMKDMDFPLDIVWLKKVDGHSFTVVTVLPSLAPASYPTVYAPQGDADAVIEINSGDAAKDGIVVGRTLTYY